jgi:ATP adenylyltransferase
MLSYLTPSILWKAASDTATAALASGALQPIQTRELVIEDGGMSFVVREVSSLLRKFSNQARAAPQRNPYLPFEPALHVGDLSPDHVVLLNKFPVMAEHLLVITRDFVAQDTLIQREDFVALAVAMVERACIAFYNAGRDAGASQPHRHLQVVPLPLERDGAGTPIDRALATVRGRSGRDVAPLGYTHVLGWLDEHGASATTPTQLGERMHERYRALLGPAGIDGIASAAGERQSRAYNLLATREWMMIVPRRRERYEGISVNALGFAGSLFVKDDAQLEIVRRTGPRAVLAAVSG